MILPAYLKSCRRRAECWVIRDDFVVDSCAILLAKSIGKCFLDGDVGTTVVEDRIDHLNRICKSDNVHVQALDL
jgi:hypothetical protein